MIVVDWYILFLSKKFDDFPKNLGISVKSN